ncbi:CsbD family protein [Synechococcus sp. 1G10]|uniref:CsbD family protein n=1 Tax=Synechococcus sp. 1G10 TaxID=2025605 RepID=UPI000B988550|nr:CsbD family protein [Synechococcus sp. 1G10]
MSLDDKIRATAKDTEGKLQAAAGELTGDDRLKTEGEAKQLQAKVMGAAGDLKDQVQGAAGAIGDAIKGLGGKGD